MANPLKEAKILLALKVIQKSKKPNVPHAAGLPRIWRHVRSNL